MKYMIYLIGKILVFLISILFLDSLWHPFPAEYHFAWWFLWFQLAIFFTWDSQHPPLTCILWIYTFWLTVRGLPLSHTWDTRWKPFLTGIIGARRMKHWEKWSDNSYYLTTQAFNDPFIIDTKSIINGPVSVSETEVKEEEKEKEKEKEKEIDNISLTDDFSFDVDLDLEQVNAAIQEIKQ